MTFDEIVKTVRRTYEHADARNVFEHVAFEIDVIGEGAGAMYFEIANRACVIEPYNYYDNDGVITANSKMILKLATKKIHLAEAIEEGLVTFTGNERKLKLVLEKVKLPE